MLSLPITAIEHFHSELCQTNICGVTRRLFVGIIQARCSCCLPDYNFRMFCRSLCLFAYFDRKVSLFLNFFYKYCISTRKSTSLLLEYCRCHSGFGPPRSKSASEYGPPFADLNPLPNFPFKHLLYHTWSLILFASFFVDVLFNHKTTLLNKGKKKKNQPFRSNSTAFITASRTVYARIRCEQTTEFELLKLLQ